MAVTIHANDVKASNLLFLCLAVACLRPIVWHAMGHISPYYPHWAVTAVFLLAVVTYLGIGWGIRAGKRWVKVVFLLYSLLNFSFTILPLFRLSALSVEVILSMLAIGLHIWAFFLIARDLLRRPVAGEAQVVGGPSPG